MPGNHYIPQKLTTLLVYGRPPLVFGGMLCAIAVMWTRSPVLYILGVVFLFVSMTFDLVDGWFAARFHPHPVMANLADRIMDKVVCSIIFPLVAVGTMWRIHIITPDINRAELLHAILVMILTVTVLVRMMLRSVEATSAPRPVRSPPVESGPGAMPGAPIAGSETP